MTVLLYFNKVLALNNFWRKSRHDCNTEWFTVNRKHKALYEEYDLAIAVADNMNPKAFESLEAKIFQYCEDNTKQ